MQNIEGITEEQSGPKPVRGTVARILAGLRRRIGVLKEGVLFLIRNGTSVKHIKRVVINILLAKDAKKSKPPSSSTPQMEI